MFDEDVDLLFYCYNSCASSSCVGKNYSAEHFKMLNLFIRPIICDLMESLAPFLQILGISVIALKVLVAGSSLLAH